MCRALIYCLVFHGDIPPPPSPLENDMCCAVNSGTYLYSRTSSIFTPTAQVRVRVGILCCDARKQHPAEDSYGRHVALR